MMIMLMMGRRPCCPKIGLNRGPWTAAEDKLLIDYIKLHGEGRWRKVPKTAGLKRCGKSCRLRWLNYLRPDIKRGNITHDEEELIIRLHKLLGNRWSLIAGRLPRRTDNEIKNYWNTTLCKRINHARHPPDYHPEDEKTKKMKKNIGSKQMKRREDDIDEISECDVVDLSHNLIEVVRPKAVKCSSAPPISIQPPTESTQPVATGSDFGCLVSSFPHQEENNDPWTVVTHKFLSPPMDDAFNSNWFLSSHSSFTPNDVAITHNNKSMLPSWGDGADSSSNYYDFISEEVMSDDIWTTSDDLVVSDNQHYP